MCCEFSKAIFSQKLVINVIIKQLFNFRAKQKRALMQSPVVAPSPNKHSLRKVELEDTNDNEDNELDVDDLHEEEDLEEVFQGEGECGSSVGSVASSR